MISPNYSLVHSPAFALTQEYMYLYVLSSWYY